MNPTSGFYKKKKKISIIREKRIFLQQTWEDKTNILAWLYIKIEIEYPNPGSGYGSEMQVHANENPNVNKMNDMDLHAQP